MTIYRNWNEGFGDTFATVNLMLRKAHFHRLNHLPKPRLSRLQHGRDLGPMHDSIRSLLNYPTDFDSVAEPGDTDLSGFNVWACDFYPTKVRWRFDAPHPHVCWQMDGVSSPEKNPSPEELVEITHILLEATGGAPVYKVGKHLGDTKCVELLAAASVFVGVDSGMSHLAHAVGVPVFLLEYGLPIVTTHRGKAYRLCEGAAGLRDKLGRYVDYRAFIGAGL
jgi:Glycosyltransferase family 9 (heptosyltransferase)